MPIHLSFKNIRNSKAVSEHVHQAFEELIKITDDKIGRASCRERV